NPALMEAYGSYFSSFELKEIDGDQKSMFDHYKGNIIYLPSNSYPVKEFETLFAATNRSAIYLGQKKSDQFQSGVQQLPIIAFNNLNQDINFILRSANTQNINEFVAQYDDLKEFRLLLRDFFKKYQEESVPNQVKLMHSIDALQIQEEKNKFKNLPLFQRLMKKMVGKGWDITTHAKL
ncbi:MAG: hypothetical protein ACXWV9_08670, partial [Flavisolibacter sp.]